MCARVPRAMAQFVLKIEKLSHIMGAAPIVELRLGSPSPIMTPDDYRNLIVFEKFCFQYNQRKDGVFKFLRFDERFLKKLPLRDELVWVEGLTGETAPELCFKSTVRKKNGGCTFCNNTLRTKLSPLGTWKDMV